MKYTEQVCEVAARDALQDYVNDCECKDRDEAKKVIQKMIAVATHALRLVESGKMETQQ